MSSKRDKLKQLNQLPLTENIDVTEDGTTIVDELVENYVETQEAKVELDPVETKIEPVSVPLFETNNLINVIDKSKVGRPKILEGEYKPISARLKIECYTHARLVGGKYGGMNGYINYLIEQDMKKSSGI